MVNSKSVTQGIAFVAFATPDEAQNALNAIAQRKDERRAKLQFQFFQRRNNAMPLWTKF